MIAQRSRSAHPRPPGMDRPRAALLCRRDRCLAHLLPAADGVGGRDGPRLCGTRACEGARGDDPADRGGTRISARAWTGKRRRRARMERSEIRDRHCDGLSTPAIASTSELDSSTHRSRNEMPDCASRPCRLRVTPSSSNALRTAARPCCCGVQLRPPVMPPSTTRSWPLTKEDSSLARNTAA